jgi:hypothetical protein
MKLLPWHTKIILIGIFPYPFKRTYAGKSPVLRGFLDCNTNAGKAAILSQIRLNRHNTAVVSSQNGSKGQLCYYSTRMIKYGLMLCFDASPRGLLLEFTKH